MMLPWMLRRTHRRAYTKQGEAYRLEIEQARSEARKARADLERFADGMSPRLTTLRPFGESVGLRLVIDVEEHLLRSETPQELLELVQRRIMERLIGAKRDYRGDLRETLQERMLRP